MLRYCTPILLLVLLNFVPSRASAAATIRIEPGPECPARELPADGHTSCALKLSALNEQGKAIPLTVTVHAPGDLLRIDQPTVQLAAETGTGTVLVHSAGAKEGQAEVVVESPQATEGRIVINVARPSFMEGLAKVASRHADASASRM
jgi:hypothetical protein